MEALLLLSTGKQLLLLLALRRQTKFHDPLTASSLMLSICMVEYARLVPH